MTDISVRDRAVLITGGGRGLGEACCHELSRRGRSIVLHDNGAGVDGRHPAIATRVAEAIIAGGGQAVACTTAAGSEAGGQEAIDLALNAFGKVDAIIANAGIIFSEPLPQWPTERFEALLRHHLLAAFHVIRPDFAVMKRAGYGRLVFVSSAADVFGQPGLTGYAAAQDGHARPDERRSPRRRGIRYLGYAIMPMGDTRMADALTGEAGRTPEARTFPETLRLDQVAPVVAYLAREHCTQNHLALSAFAGGWRRCGWVSPADGSVPAAR